MDGTGDADADGLPRGLRPMLATAGPLPAGPPGWAFEMKWDGLRAISYVTGDGFRLVSRTGRDITHAYPELAGLAAAVRAAGAQRAVLDGEIVALATAPGAAAGAARRPSFEALQQRMNISSADDVRLLAGRVPVTYLAFDLLSLNGHALLDLPWAQRRGLLEELRLTGDSWLTPPAFTTETAQEVQAASVQQGLEGVVAKRQSGRYEPGRRSAGWVKVKNVLRQEAVVGGWQPGERGRSGQIGSLLIGVYQAGGLAYAGHVGTGFTRQTLDLLARRLAPLRRATSPFVTEVPPEHARFAVWAEPALVVEVAFTEWTTAGRLRAPSYKGLRDDKDPLDVVRET
ncbi:MAG TPA: non-homologous end-joining DNA ligase [Streptosporangiaceae bacterium]|nr:non-homologous end-joining DNA ligase [Streptosporangiaceae bacterium]